MPDFSKIWATNSPLPEFNFTDSEYLTGWDFVAAAPPTKSQFDAWFRLTDQKLQWLYDQLQSTANKLYPVGSVYISFNSADPSTLFGGTWQRLKDTFLLANGDTYAANTTGGSATKTITVANMPAHNHSVNSAGSHTHTATTSSAGNHTHSASSNTTGNHYHGAMGEKSTYGSLYGLYDSNNTHLGNDGTDSDNAIWRTSTNGNHSHTITVNANGNHTHTLTTASNGSHTHTIGNTGSGLPLNIMPPYKTVYMWRRTA